MNRFAYARPADVGAAVRALGDDPGARVLAGGTNLVDLMKYDVEWPGRLVDINRLPGLDAIEGTAGGEYGYLSGEVSASASAEARAEGDVTLGPTGVHAGGELFAGARAEIGAQGDIGGIGGEASVEGWAGAGIAGDLDLGYRDGKIEIGGSGGVAWGLDDVEDSEDIWPYVDSYLARYAPSRPDLRDAVLPALRLGWVCRALNNPEVSGPEHTAVRLRMFLDGKPE